MHLAMQHGPTSIAAALRPRRRRLPGWLLAALLLSSNGAIGAPAFQDAPRSAAAAKTAAAGTHLVAAIVGIALGIGAAIAVGALVAQVRRRAAIADESSKAAARMLAFASHEIRNPVHGIAGLAELLERSPLDAEQRRIVATIRETAFGLGRLADDFLQHARLNLGQLPPRPAATSPAALVGSVLALERAAADRKRIRLESRVGDDVPAWVLVDAPRLRQVLLNLVGNAIRHSAAGEVSVRVAAVPGHGARLRFEVRDSGRGLGPAERERLFQPFAHDTETMRPPEAVGIGLSISKQLVESVGGVIGIDPQTVRGSCFWFEVDAPACIEPDPEGGRTGQPLPPLRAYVVDDDPVSLEVTLAQLAHLGVAARGSNDPVEVTAALGGDCCDVVLLDYQMPGLDGLSLARRLRHPGDPKARPRLLILSGEDRARVTGVDDTVDGWLLKPVSLSELEAALRRLFGSDPARALAPVPAEAPALLDEAAIADLARLRIEGRPADAVLAARVVRALDRQLAPIGEAVAGGERGAAARLAHRLRGTVAPLGCAALAAALGRLEDLLRGHASGAESEALALVVAQAAATRDALAARYALDATDGHAGPGAGAEGPPRA